ncbi:MAG: hypothetical protein V7641_3318 [Blastocatellia bacterium]
MVDQDEIERLMHLPEQDLLSQWHDEQMKETVGASADDLVGVFGDLRSAFVNWCSRRNLHEIICKQWDYPAMKQKHATRLQLTCALADFLAVSGGYPPPFIVAVLLVQQFAEEICRDG